MAVAEDHRVGVGEAAAQPSQPPLRRPGVVDHRDADAREVDFQRLRQQALELGFVDVATHGVHRTRTEHLDLPQRRGAEEVTRVERPLRPAQQPGAARRQHPPALRHMGVGEDRDQAVPRARSMKGPSRSATEAAVESGVSEGLVM